MSQYYLFYVSAGDSAGSTNRSLARNSVDAWKRFDGQRPVDESDAEAGVEKSGELPGKDVGRVGEDAANRRKGGGGSGSEAFRSLEVNMVVGLLNQGILAKEEGSVQLTSLYYLSGLAAFHTETIFFLSFLKIQPFLMRRSTVLIHWYCGRFAEPGNLVLTSPV